MSRSTIAEQEDLVKESLFKFVRKHIPSAQLSSIDEIVLSYVVSILEDLGTEASVEEAFDVEGFSEMMAAYFPEFSTIHHAAVCQWMFELEATLSQKKGKDGGNKFSNKDLSELALLPLANLTPRSHNNSECISGDVPSKRIHQLSENSDGSSDSSGEYFSNQEDSAYVATQVHLLQEMFPGVCIIEVRHCLAIAEGDVARAAQLVLHRQEAGQSLTPNATVLQPMAQRQKAVVDDQELKSRIIARYSYVDKDDDVREHRPVGPKSEPKKLVRYRDNKIVSLKGERFTEVKKEEEDDMKKTYVSIKAARQYRLH
ncbi:CUE domain-containing protein 2 [Zootermopsis nevadensis]|uniref:CUE domain-containing protein 2 n=1 Tax=Zootermopsis nevadensis TaxID=136037 RepID=A0A067RBD4_ZOONE|nr:CUE domain-containing protein 2 [Zootermopsis nevadensis]XP_021918574.1 CUE domain-containing protein 2 [Zootermopsis nevadensis]KDR20147.1 CUE domain-containing protein 2 [Zootermopsis nevadensis]